MAFADLRGFLEVLEREGELSRVATEVDWNLELGAISRRAMDLQGPALLFENLTGYPRGSGGIEASNKCIGHVRLKRSGAWWYAANSQHMLALRCAKYNGTLDQVFVRYQQRLRETSE